MSEPVVVSWSGGKDSFMALRWALHQPSLRVAALVTTVTDGYDRISMHGVRRALLEAQARALGVPLEIVRIPQSASNAAYEAAMGAAFATHRELGVRRVVFGDLFLEDIRAYRERMMAEARLEGLFPLWGRDTRRLAHEVIDLDVQATLVCVDPNQLDPLFCGRAFDWPMLADLPAWIDPCGERGEFHTFVHGGPLFRRPVAVARGEIVERDGFWFCDLLPASEATARPS
jgi:uncharacterized protein (TIGR00290 family)